MIFIWANIHLQQQKTHEFKVQCGWFTSKPLVLIRIMCAMSIKDYRLTTMAAKKTQKFFFQKF